MSTLRCTILSAAVILSCGLANLASAQNFDRTFLNDYSKLVATQLKDGAVDMVYVVPGVEDKAAKYTALMIDQPEVLMSQNSDYKGAKPADLEAIAELMRKEIADAMKAGGYEVVDTPGPNVLYMKLAATDLGLARKKRGLLAYTPVGFVVKAGVDATRDMMEKYDILGVNVQGQYSDSVSNDLLAEFVGVRGNNGQRMTFDQLDSDLKKAASALRCRMDNSHVTADKRINCLDPEARAAREAANKH
jgi:hypothetical protein